MLVGINPLCESLGLSQFQNRRKVALACASFLRNSGDRWSTFLGHLLQLVLSAPNMETELSLPPGAGITFSSLNAMSWQDIFGLPLAPGVHIQLRNDHAVGSLDEEVFQQGVCEDSVSEVIVGRCSRVEEFLRGRSWQHELVAEAAVNSQQQCDAVPCATGSEPRKGARKRDRDRNWTEEETAVLVECKRRAFHDKGSSFRKAKSNATNWAAISKELRNSPDTRASEKTGDQCRLRWDTLVKSHRAIKERCLQKNKGYAELTEEEMSELKLATTLDKGWYEVIDTISRKARSQKGRGNLTPVAEDSSNPESRLLNDPLTVCSRNTQTDSDLYRLFLDGASRVSAHSYPSSTPCRQGPTGRPDPSESSRKQIAIPGFFSMDAKLRATLLDLIFGARFLKDRCLDGDFSTEEDENLSFSCRWLSIVQNRSCSEIYNDVNRLVKMKLVHISEDFGRVSIKQSRFRVFNKFVKKAILKNPDYDTHLRIGYQTMSTLEASSLPQQITVLQLEGCEELKTANFRGLRKLRSLSLFECPKLVEVTGWKFLRELGWLDIDSCPSYRDYPDLQDLPSLREFRFAHGQSFECPRRFELDMSRCVRLRRLKIFHDNGFEGTGDLSSLKCLEFLSFGWCGALSSISGLNGLHLLRSLHLGGCISLQSLPDIGHMKELVHVDVRDTNLEEIPGIEKLVSLKCLDCMWSKLKRLPDLHHLPELRKVSLKGTPLIEEDPSSFYFDKEEVVFNREERGHVDVSDLSDTEYNISDSEASLSDDSLSCDDVD